MSRTADRIVAGEWAFPLGLDENRGFLEHVSGYLADPEEPCPVVVADNVAWYVQSRNPAICLEDYPSLAPPWPTFWMEYPSSSAQRRGVFTTDITAAALAAAPAVAIEWEDDDVSEWVKGETHVPALGAAAMLDAERNGAPRDDVRWVIAFALFVEQDRRVWGPAGILCLALDAGGQVLGNRWSVAPVMGLRRKTEDIIHAGTPTLPTDEPLPTLAEMMERAESMTDGERRELYAELVTQCGVLDERVQMLNGRIAELGEARDSIGFLGSLGATDETTWLIRALAPAMQTVAFMHCQNVSLATVEAHPKVQAKRARRGRPLLLRYQTLALDLPRRQGADRASGGLVVGKSLHIVAGHFAHYGACCPGHPPRGLLFGRLTGVYWVPTHARGDARLGGVHTDFEVRAVEAAS